MNCIRKDRKRRPIIFTSLVRTAIISEDTGLKRIRNGSQRHHMGRWRSPSICPNRKKIRKRSRQQKMLHRVVIRNASCVRKMKATPVASIIRQDRITGSFRSGSMEKTGDFSIHRMCITMNTASFSTESMCR